jgi:hypothetical protein
MAGGGAGVSRISSTLDVLSWLARDWVLKPCNLCVWGLWMEAGRVSAAPHPTPSTISRGGVVAPRARAARPGQRLAGQGAASGTPSEADARRSAPAT